MLDKTPKYSGIRARLILRKVDKTVCFTQLTALFHCVNFYERDEETVKREVLSMSLWAWVEKIVNSTK